jgi:hypothetical protein
MPTVIKNNVPVPTRVNTNVMLKIDNYSKIKMPSPIKVKTPTYLPSKVPQYIPTYNPVPEPTQTFTPVPVKVTDKPPIIPFIPQLDFGNYQYGFGRRAKSKKGYIPSFDAFLLGIKAKKSKYKKQAFYVGTETRPILI